MNNFEPNKIYQGHVLEVLKTFPDESVDMIITSPPYFGLRDYGEETKTIWDGALKCRHEWQTKERFLHRGSTKTTIHSAIQKGGLKVEWKTKDNTCVKCGAWHGQLGLEPTLELYLAHLLQITAELKRVLKKEGTLWWNHGDSYNGTGGNRQIETQRDTYKKYNSKLQVNQDGVHIASMPEKCLLMQPYRLAQMMIEKQQWHLRNILIWNKPNAMPSSVKDRFTNDYEPILLFSKSRKYYFETQLEPADYDGRKDTMMKGSQKYASGEFLPNKNPHNFHVRGYERWQEDGQGNKMRNKRSTWRIPTKSGGQGIHFATFPPALVKIPIEAGCPKEICTKCGKAREPIFKSKSTRKRGEWHPEKYGENDPDGKRLGRTYPTEYIENTAQKIGYTKCKCNAEFQPGIVLDCFMGSGITAQVARELGRQWVGIEISSKYIKMAEERLAQSMLF